MDVRQRSSVADVHVSCIRRKRNTNPNHAVSFRAIERPQDNAVGKLSQRGVSNFEDLVLLKPTEHILIPNAVGEANNIWIIAHPGEGVAISKVPRARVTETQVVADLVD